MASVLTAIDPKNRTINICCKRESAREHFRLRVTFTSCLGLICTPCHRAGLRIATRPQVWLAFYRGFSTKISPYSAFINLKLPKPSTSYCRHFVCLELHQKSTSFFIYEMRRRHQTNILLALKLGDHMEVAVDASHLSSENKVFPLDNKVYYCGPLITSSCRRKQENKT